MVILKCLCLNVHLHLARAPVPLSPDSDSFKWVAEQTSMKKMGEADLGMAGSKAVLQRLTTTRKLPRGWKLTRCCNCNLDIFLVSLTNPTQSIVNLELEEAASNPTASPTISASTPQHMHYSPAFHIYLADQSADFDKQLLVAPADSDPSAVALFNKLQGQVDQYLADEERNMDKRIKAFVKEQNELLNDAQAVVYRDRKILWNLISNVGPNPSLPSTPLSPSSNPLSVSSDWTTGRVLPAKNTVAPVAPSPTGADPGYKPETTTPNGTGPVAPHTTEQTAANTTTPPPQPQAQTPAQAQAQAQLEVPPDTLIHKEKVSPSPTPKRPRGLLSKSKDKQNDDAMFDFDEDVEDEEPSSYNTLAAPPIASTDDDLDEPEAAPERSEHGLSSHRVAPPAPSAVSDSSARFLGTSLPVVIPMRHHTSTASVAASTKTRKPRPLAPPTDPVGLDQEPRPLARTYVVPRQSWAPASMITPDDIQPDMAHSFMVPMSLNMRMKSYI
eukprot:TRINITY_DN4283_c0_g1_i3.p1 TRINITY_DN4283_c0_g1~~TRINITY_DN4283_c0_g1_i3.p1  ORF type:complete len:499 (-),score=116.64 TRINITY_DN4283_c0_g1_i3:12-1508(-)